MIRLGVNIDHVATLRQARRADEPDPVAAAVLALLGGADGITVHLREDRRHIQDRDVRLLRPVVTNRLNLEMAAVDAIADFACEIKPDEATLVPERREELTTEGGLDVVAHEAAVGPHRAAAEGLRHPGLAVHRPQRGADRRGPDAGRQGGRDPDGPLFRGEDAGGAQQRAGGAARGGAAAPATRGCTSTWATA